MSSKRTPLSTADTLTLPFWPQDLRALPNVFARSALFVVASVRKGARRVYRRHKVVSLKGVSITYSGDELRQDDEDVFLQILHLARGHELGTEVRFSSQSMIRELKWTRNSESVQRLIDSIDRMKASSVSVTIDSSDGQTRQNFTGSLIRAFRWQEHVGATPLREWEVLLEREIVALFGPGSYSRLDWSMRLKLAPLEKWLHSFYHTHQRPYPVSVKLIHELTGSEIPASELRKFRYKLKKALEKLVEIGFFKVAIIDPKTDLVIVERVREHQSIVQR